MTLAKQDISTQTVVAYHKVDSFSLSDCSEEEKKPNSDKKRLLIEDSSPKSDHTNLVDLQIFK